MKAIGFALAWPIVLIHKFNFLKLWARGAGDEAKEAGEALGHIAVKVAVGKLTGGFDLDDLEDDDDDKADIVNFVLTSDADASDSDDDVLGRKRVTTNQSGAPATKRQKKLNNC